MKLTRIVPLGLALGAAGWMVRRSTRMAGAVARPVLSTAEEALRRASELGVEQVDDVARRTVGETSPQEADRARADSLTRDAVEEIVESEPAGSTLGEVAEQDPASLVEAERELLTVAGAPGDGHRRRDQTAGAAAQEIAAAQVRARRNG